MHKEVSGFSEFSLVRASESVPILEPRVNLQDNKAIDKDVLSNLYEESTWTLMLRKHEMQHFMFP